MKFLRQTLTALAVAGTLFGAACVADTTGSDAQNTIEISENLMQKTPVAPGEFAITRDKSGEWFFELVGENGDIVLLSEGYVERPSALNGILSIEDNGVHLGQYVISDDGAGNWTFVLRAKNNQVIADSQIYRSEQEAKAGVETARELVAGILQFKAAVENGARFDLWRDQTDKQWYFVLRAEDGSVLLESEDYTGRTGAVNGIESVRFNGKDEGRYAVVEGDSEVYYILKAANGQEIGASGSFESVAQAEAGIKETATLLQSERVASPW